MYAEIPWDLNYSCFACQGEVEVMMMRRKTLGISNLRFLPKTSSLRPIINLGSKVNLGSTHPVGRYGQRELKSVNHQLLDLFHVLKFEKVNYSTSHHYTDVHYHTTAWRYLSTSYAALCVFHQVSTASRQLVLRVSWHSPSTEDFCWEASRGKECEVHNGLTV